MVPGAFGHPGFWVTLTGVLEILGALGLIVPGVTPLAGLGLALLLLSMFPANVRAARDHLTIGGRAVMPLLPRVALQIVFLAATLAVAFEALPR
jgi:uncharacterized membrane protein